MESRVNLAVVGAFVLVLVAGGIGALLWLGGGRVTQQEYDTYVALFGESVTGLSTRAPVRMQGVNVGSVQDIALDPEDPSRVRVMLSIVKGTPVKMGTYATLQVQGLTGIASIELGGGTRDAPPLRARPGERYPLIATRPSLMARLDVAATTLAAEVGRVTASLNDTLDPETRQALRSSAADLARILGTVAGRTSEIDRAAVAADRLLGNAARASAALPGLVERLGRSAEAVERMATELAQVGVAARAAVQDARGTIDQVGAGVERFQGEVLPDVRRLLAELRETSASLGRVSAELERDPSALVLGRAERPPGPGE